MTADELRALSEAAEATFMELFAAAKTEVRNEVRLGLVQSHMEAAGNYRRELDNAYRTGQLVHVDEVAAAEARGREAGLREAALVGGIHADFVAGHETGTEEAILSRIQEPNDG